VPLRPPSAGRGVLKPSRPHHAPTIERQPWRRLAAPAMNSQGRVGRTDPAAWPGIAIVDQFDLRLP
jgi:hypothetical protein